LDKNQVIQSIKLAREVSKQRNFKQSFDLVINLRGLNPKKAEDNIDLFVQLNNSTGRKVKFCAFVDYDLEKQAKETCDLVILKDHFQKYEGKKKELRKIARNYDYFIAQANIMPQVATLVGKVLGPLEKMPNPKAGCVVPGNLPSLKPLIEKLKNTIRLRTKKELSIKALVGIEDMKDEEVANNVFTIYNNLIQNLPQERHNVKSMLIKLTMGSPIFVGKEYKKDEIDILVQKTKDKDSEKSPDKNKKVQEE